MAGKHGDKAMNGFFIALWVGSALLFRQAACGSAISPLHADETF